jgi:hypothetical protein
MKVANPLADYDIAAITAEKVSYIIKDLLTW